MCGVFGLVAKEKSNLNRQKIEKIVTVLFKLSETRGKDASGITIQTKDEIFVYKKSVSASNLIKDNQYKNFLDKAFRKTVNQNKLIGPLTIMGHARMQTNGSFCRNFNNQPVVKDGMITIHNGIVVNDQQIWQKYPELKRKYDVDTEVVNSLVRKYLKETGDPTLATKQLFASIEGSASLGVFFNDYNYLLLATNTGSLYLLEDKKNGFDIFASELFILNSLKQSLSSYQSKSDIRQIKPNTGCFINLLTLEKILFSLNRDVEPAYKLEKNKSIKKIVQEKTKENKLPKEKDYSKIKKIIDLRYKKNLNRVKAIKRCKKCVLPETMPFISFDKNGICNYCRSYEKKKVLGAKNLEKLTAKYKRSGNKQNCIVCLSGGRDSSYTLHYVKKVLGLNPIAYSYDWGMLTDLGRRNQARMCAELGVEHILVAADIQKKREYIKLNVKAWLKKPELGMIPLFMAGDKQYFYYVNQIKKNNDIELVIMGENYLEQTYFKNGFAGVRQKGSMAYHVPLLEKIRLLFYYFIQYVKNPGYLNASFFDSLSAFFSYFLIPHDYLNIYDYIKWDEDMINKTLIEKYNWETAKESESTWRIGDGTAAFYNYIYYTIAGFSEFDTFRSNQIRERIISREKALKLVDEENKPRLEAIKWYCNTINIDHEKTINRINSINPIY